MTRSRRPSAQTVAVVLALAERPADWRYGYQLCQQLDIKPGSMYPILMRLTDRGLLETSWGADVPAGRRPRHLHRLPDHRPGGAPDPAGGRPARRAGRAARCTGCPPPAGRPPPSPPRPEALRASP